MNCSNTSFLLVLLVVISTLTTGEGLDATKWDINGDPQSSVEDFTVSLTYDVHDSITAINIAGQFRELLCEEDGNVLTEADGLLDWGSDVSTPGKGTLWFTYDMDLFKSNSNIFDANVGFKLCVTYILRSDNGVEHVTEKTLDMVLSLESAAGMAFEMPDPDVDENGNPIIQEVTFVHGWGIEAYLCDAASPSVPVPDMTFNQGSLISVCITPSADAIAQGVVMDRINSFVWNRGDAQQSAVENGLAAANSLTNYDCSPGALYCTISTVLKADFYFSRRNLQFALHPELRSASTDRGLLESVKAVGSGQAVLMYGTGGSRRGLQESDIETDTADLEISVNIWMQNDKYRLVRVDESVSETSGASSLRAGILIFTAVGVLFTNGAMLFA